MPIFFIKIAFLNAKVQNFFAQLLTNIPIYNTIITVLIGDKWRASFIDRLATKFPDAPMDRFEAYQSSNLVIIETTFMMYGECACDYYHFLLSTHNTSQVITNNKLHMLKANSLFPCNLGQPYRSMDTDARDFKAFIFYVDNVFLQHISKTMFDSESLVMYSNFFGLSPRMKNLMNYFMQESCSMQPGSELQLQSLSVEIAVCLLREGSHNLSFRSLNFKEYIDKRCVKKTIEYLEENYNINITLDELAGEMNYSPYHFLRIFKSATGMTPFEYLINIKIEKAKYMLRHTSLPIEQISDFCGFSSSSYFAQAFRKKTGVTPTAYKRSF